MTMYVDYLLMRIGEQREEVERKLVAFEALERDQRARALREIKDNYKELLTGVIRHGSQPSVFQLGPQGATLERGLGHVLFGESLPVKWTSCCCIVLLTRHCCAGCVVEQQRVGTQPSSRLPTLLLQSRANRHERVLRGLQLVHEPKLAGE